MKIQAGDVLEYVDGKIGIVVDSSPLIGHEVDHRFTSKLTPTLHLHATPFTFESILSGRKEIISFEKFDGFKIIHLIGGEDLKSPRLWAHIDSISFIDSKTKILIGDIFSTKNLKA